MVRRKPVSILLGLILIGSLLPAAWAGDTVDDVKERGVLVVGVRNDAPPFGFVDPISGEVVGIDVDLAGAVAARLNVKLKVQIVTSQTWIPYLLNGNVDLVAATVTRNPDRGKLVDFSLAYFKTAQRVLTRKGTVTTLEDLGGKKIGTTQGAAAERNIRDLVPTAACYFFSDSDKAVEALQKGEIDALSASGSVLYGCLSALPEGEYEIPGSIKLSEDGFRMAVRKRDTRLLELVNSTLTELNEKGDAKKIFDQWFRNKGEGGLLTAAATVPQAFGVVTRGTSTEGRFLVLPIQGIFRPQADISIFDPQGNFIGDGKIASIYEDETYIDSRGVPTGLIQPGFVVGMGYSNMEAQKFVLSRKDVIGQVVKGSKEEEQKIQRDIAQDLKREKQERDKFQEDMTKSKMYLDYQYSDYYYRFR